MTLSGGTAIIFKLVIDKSAEETVVATVRKSSSLTDQLETLVMQYSGEDRIAAYPVFPSEESRLSSRDEIRMLHSRRWNVSQY